MLISWKAFWGHCRRIEPFGKRLRLEHLQNPLDQPSAKHLGIEATTVERLTSESASSSAVHIPWNPLKVRHRSNPDQTDAKKIWEDRLKDKWSKELYLCLVSASAPVLKGMDFCVGIDRVHLAIAGKTRSTTLKRYVKAWKSWQHWKHLTWGDDSFVHPGMFCEYLFTRFDEPCGPSIPGFICKAINWFEKLAGFEPADRVGDCRAVIQVRDYMTEQLMKEGPPIRRAPRYPAICIDVFESVVLDDQQLLGTRILAWTRLIKIWGALRYDDMQKIRPAELHLTQGRLTTTLRVTKTSGPGKRVQELPVCISERAYVWDPSCRF